MLHAKTKDGLVHTVEAQWLGSVTLRCDVFSYSERANEGALFATDPRSVVVADDEALTCLSCARPRTP